MGLNYSIKLYYKSSEIENALNSLVTIANYREGNSSTIELPNGCHVVLPFNYDSKNRFLKLIPGDEGFTLDTSLIFSVDRHIKEYYEQYGDKCIEERVGIGTILLTITAGKSYVELDFTAVTSAMSMLFLQSKSIKSEFIEFMNQTNGLFGIVDIEDYYYLVLADIHTQIQPPEIEKNFYPYYDIDLFVNECLNLI